ncbi:unnamed protein product [Colias eurytheme]|nr:unnamed protein product [Colias eurytheme]
MRLGLASWLASWLAGWLAGWLGGWLADSVPDSESDTVERQRRQLVAAEVQVPGSEPSAQGESFFNLQRAVLVPS